MGGLMGWADGGRRGESAYPRNPPKQRRQLGLRRRLQALHRLHQEDGCIAGESAADKPNALAA